MTKVLPPLVTEKRQGPKAMWERSQLLNFKLITLHSLRSNEGSDAALRPNCRTSDKLPDLNRKVPKVPGGDSVDCPSIDRSPKTISDFRR